MEAPKRDQAQRPGSHKSFGWSSDLITTNLGRLLACFPVYFLEVDVSKEVCCGFVFGGRMKWKKGETVVFYVGRFWRPKKGEEGGKCQEGHREAHRLQAVS